MGCFQSMNEKMEEIGPIPEYSFAPFLKEHCRVKKGHFCSLDTLALAFACFLIQKTLTRYHVGPFLQEPQEGGVYNLGPWSSLAEKIILKIHHRHDLQCLRSFSSSTIVVGVELTSWPMAFARAHGYNVFLESESEVDTTSPLL